jgi:hypothetical protein
MKQWQRWWVWLMTAFIFQIFFMLPGWNLNYYEAADENSYAFLQINLTQNSFIFPNVLASGQNAQTIFNSIKEAFPDRQNIQGMGDDASRVAIYSQNMDKKFGFRITISRSTGGPFSDIKVIEKEFLKDV